MTNLGDETNLCETLEGLNLIIDNLGDCVSVKDREHRVVYANAAFVRSTGLSRKEDILGKTVEELFPDERTRALREQEERIFQSGKEGLDEEECNDADGRTHVNLVKKTVITDAKGDKLMIVLARDITEYRQMRDQLLKTQKMESLGILAGKIAHDFNNLLNVINGYCDMIMEDLEDDSPIREDLEKIREAGQSAVTLTAQLQIVGQKPKQGSQKELLNLNDIVADNAQVLAQLVGDDVRLVKELEPALGVISSAPGELSQMLMDLATNAKDAMPEGGTLTVATSNCEVDEAQARKHPWAKAGSFVCLSVKDDGVGMDADTQNRLFEPFFTTKGKGRGTGLGLSSVYGIVKQSGGFVEVQSKPGKGSEFKIYFPVENR
ncbi:MAG: PAS domain S-box protein [Acidobacteriota bacterium]|jgi:PAS domain S-box-containing protein|nr:PAS domain S-box protein [Acidobacteriota bacterium]